MTPRTKEQIVKLFTFEKPFALQYGKLGRRREQWLSDRKIINEMITSGEVKVIQESRKDITYLYSIK